MDTPIASSPPRTADRARALAFALLIAAPPDRPLACRPAGAPDHPPRDGQPAPRDGEQAPR